MELNMPKEETIEHRRAKYLDATLQYVLDFETGGKNNYSIKDVFKLNNSLTLKTIRFYTQNLDVLKGIYAIEDKVEASKIAGLMANAILRFRPLVPIAGQDECEEIEDNDCNELLAVYHGLDVCAAAYPNGTQLMKDFMAKESFDKWLKQFMYLILEREYSAESLIVIFETLCVTVLSNDIKQEPLPVTHLQC
jgi:hypothetical protein